jgi:gamma-glutamyltranspeptidase/glutathione hydrolase
MKKQLFFCFAIISWKLGAGQTLQQAGINPFDYKIEKKLIASKGAVASAHPLASLVGASMLKQGGNAFDAAIATQLALAVVYPNAGNLGGGGFLVGQLSNGKQVGQHRKKSTRPSGCRSTWHRSWTICELFLRQTFFRQTH